METLAHQVADVECLSPLPGEEECFDLPLRLSSSLSQLVMSGGKETNMKNFFKEQAYPSHEFILSLDFSGKRDRRASYFPSAKLGFAGQFSSCPVDRVSHSELTKFVIGKQ